MQMILVGWNGFVRVRRLTSIDEQVVVADVRRVVAGAGHAHVPEPEPDPERAFDALPVLGPNDISVGAPGSGRLRKRAGGQYQTRTENKLLRRHEPLRI